VLAPGRGGGEYKALFLAMLARIRDFGVTAPVYVARASFCANGEHPYRNHEAVRAAQRGLVSLSRGIRPGPDTDTLGTLDRYDGCHFSAAGLDRHAELWLTVLRRGALATAGTVVIERLRRLIARGQALPGGMTC
jgi:hypothetical protein